jgi:small subunit ribosomal protein S33
MLRSVANHGWQSVQYVVASGIGQVKRTMVSSVPESTTTAYASIRAGVAPATGRQLAEVAAEVWGHAAPSECAKPGERSARKLLARPLKGPMYAAWYPPRPESMKFSEFKLTEKQERWQNKLRVLRAAGKGPPKKGAGKRASK